MTAAVSLPNERHPVGVRLATDEEKTTVILANWLGYEASMPPYQPTYGMSRREWIQTGAEHAMSQGLTFVATVEGYDDVVLGWACSEPPHTLHYVYVKRQCRHRGIGRMLVAAAGIQGRSVRLTHRPRKELRGKIAALGWQYKPFAKEELLG
jgi:ribosomal protein S18 acetylase RimI-like enzyme